MPDDSAGDPFASKTLIDRAKEVWNGVALYWKSVIEDERKKWEAARTPVIERDTVPNEEDDCPHCHAKASMRNPAGNVTRCCACGWQPRIVNAPGISRSQLESFRYPDAEHKRKFQQGFGQAVARISGRK